MGDPLSLSLAEGADLTPIEPWVTPDQLGGCTSDDQVDLSSVCKVATEMLFIMSGRRYGVRTVTERPYSGQRTCGWNMYPEAEWLWRYDRNELEEPDWVKLSSPVRNVTGVILDGHLLDSSEYVLFDDQRLVRSADPVTGMRLCWPLFQRLDLDLSENGTFGIHYQWGADVPEGGLVSAKRLGCELAKYMANEKGCALTDLVTTVNRQGVTRSIDISKFIAERRTGIRLVDMWLNTVNPNGNRRRPSIVSPDKIQNVRPT